MKWEKKAKSGSARTSGVLLAAHRPRLPQQTGTTHELQEYEDRTSSRECDASTVMRATIQSNHMIGPISTSAALSDFSEQKGKQPFVYLFVNFTFDGGPPQRTP